MDNSREGIICGTLAYVENVAHPATSYTRHTKRGRYGVDFETVPFMPEEVSIRISVLITDVPKGMLYARKGSMFKFILPSITSLFNDSEIITDAVTDSIYLYVVLKDDDDPDRVIHGTATGWWRFLSTSVLRKRKLAAAAADNGYALY